MFSDGIQFGIGVGIGLAAVGLIISLLLLLAREGLLWRGIMAIFVIAVFAAILWGIDEVRTSNRTWLAAHPELGQPCPGGQEHLGDEHGNFPCQPTNPRR